MTSLREILRVAIALPRVELARRRSSLHRAVETIRRHGSPRRRSVEERRHLRRAIAIVDARLPGDPNCVRRSLLEMALDRGAADEKLFAGFVSHGGPKSGHAWLESDPVQRQFDAVIAI
jgi:hypothetical protein